jgi:hypothetical protein
MYHCGLRKEVEMSVNRDSTRLIFNDGKPVTTAGANLKPPKLLELNVSLFLPENYSS